MKLGKIQKKWLNSLKKYPHSQLKDILGEIQPDGTYKACCLGELLLIIPNSEAEWNKDGGLVCKGRITCIVDYKEYGLNGTEGDFKKTVIINNKKYKSLAHMNDGGLTWPEIAEYVEKHPENVFNKSF